MTDTRLRLDDQLCFAAYSAANAIMRSYRPRLQELGLTYPQYLVMMALWQDGSCTVGQVAARVGMASHAVTPLLARLTTAGYLDRQPDPRDRRVVHLHLTEAGRHLESRAARARDAVAEDVGLDAASLRNLRDQLIGVVNQLCGPGQPKKTSASA